MQWLKEGIAVYCYLRNENINPSMLVIPTKLINGVPSSQHHLVPHNVFSVLTPT